MQIYWHCLYSMLSYNNFAVHNTETKRNDMQQVMGGSDSGERPPLNTKGSRRVPSWIPGSPRVIVNESLSKTLNPQLLPVSSLVPCMVSSAICVYECAYEQMNVRNNLCKVSWIMAVYKCTVYHLIQHCQCLVLHNAVLSSYTKSKQTTVTIALVLKLLPSLSNIMTIFIRV